MGFLKRLFGTPDASRPEVTPSRQHTADPGSPSQGRSERGVVGLLLFERGRMSMSYGQQAFDAIYSGMRTSGGTCVFHDGDDLGQFAAELFTQADRSEPSGPQSALAKRDSLSRIGLYLAALWTDDSSNFSKVHAHLASSAVPGYLGHFTLPGPCTVGEFHQMMGRLSLPASITLVNGEVVKGTSKYGIGIDRNDHALMLAAMRGQVAEVTRLIAQGADVNYVDPLDRRSTPLSYAMAGSHAEIVRLLRKAGARQ